MSKPELTPCLFCGSQEVKPHTNAWEKSFVVCNFCGARGPLMATHSLAIAEWQDHASAEITQYRIALADAIRRPMGTIPDSAAGLITGAELMAAEERRASQ